MLIKKRKKLIFFQTERKRFLKINKFGQNVIHL